LTTTAGPDRTGDTRLARIESLLASDPARAEREAGELLAEHPDHAMARLFQGIARRLLGNPAGAIEVLAPLSDSVPGAPLPHLQLALARRETGDREGAEQAMRRAVAAKPDFSDAWLALADLLVAKGDAAGADRAFIRYLELSAQDPRLREPAAALNENRTADAERFLRQHLQRHPTDVRAISMLADVALRHSRYDAAEALLQECLKLAPGYRAARHNYAVLLMRREKPAAALREIDRLLAGDPANANLQNLKAATLQRMGDYAQAVGIYEQILEKRPDEQGVWASLGHALRTLGRLDDAVEAYRKAAALMPEFGEAYWNLANLKTFRFTEPEIETMRAQLAKPNIAGEHRVNLNFAIGKALEDAGAFEESFRHYAEGNRLRREQLDYDAREISEYVRSCESLFTREFFEERAGYGDPSADPVFVVGLPRSGSTLVEQILSSHSAVEGTMELSHVSDIVHTLVGQAQPGTAYPGLLAGIGQSACAELGASYLERAAVQRHEGTPFFIDKTPHNFLQLGLIHLMLPNARVVDVRRQPMACGLSVFRHLFAHGQKFSYSLEDIGRYYRDYVALMAHFDSVLPGRVHRVSYEALVEDTEAEVRRLLDYCGLAFEESCLRFFDNRRAVSTPSSEQVRMPIFRDALDHWRNFEPWLGPLQSAIEASEAGAGDG
jgi:tetratricopeptide (TPR) repeat protein